MRFTFPPRCSRGSRQAVSQSAETWTVGPVGQHVEHCGPRLRLLDNLPQLLGRRVSLHAEADADLLVPVANLVRETEDPPQVDVAFDGRLDLGQLHAAGGGDVAHAGGDACRDGVEQELHRCGRVILADEHLRVVGVELDVARVAVLAAGAAERLDPGTAVGAPDPGVGRPELEPGEIRLPLHRVQGGKERWRVYAVHRHARTDFRFCCLHVAHGCSPVEPWIARSDRDNVNGGRNPPRREHEGWTSRSNARRTHLAPGTSMRPTGRSRQGRFVPIRPGIATADVRQMSHRDG